MTPEKGRPDGANRPETPAGSRIMGSRKSTKWFVAVLVLLAFATLVAGAAAQKKKVGGGGVIRLEETVIEGRVRKPNAFFIDTRSDLVYEVLEIKESFVGEIGKVVSDGSF
jgi:hypothetical protein